MGERRFDQLAKTVAATGSRRAIVRTVVGGALAATLARLGGRDVGAQDVGTDATPASCRGTCDACDGDGKCCSGHCDGGVCRCRERGRCAQDRACCSGRCRNDGTCTLASDPGCGDGRCPAGKPAINNHVCPVENGEAICKQTDTEFCVCVRTVGGSTQCVDVTNEECPTKDECDRDADCRGERVCVKVGGCCGSRRNACFAKCAPGTGTAGQPSQSSSAVRARSPLLGG